MLLWMMVLFMYGSSIVSEKNGEQIVMIKESENVQLLKKIVDTGFNTPTDDGYNINCFLFYKKDFYFINKRVPDIKFIETYEMKNVASDFIIQPDIFYKEASKQGLIKPGQKFEIQFNFVDDKNIVKDNSWSGFVYRLMGGQFIPDTITDISDRLEELKVYNNEETLGICLINDVIYLFIKYGNDRENKIIKEIHGYSDKISSLELLLYLFEIGN
ncbi:hypothetical protein DMUE_0821 [Dictyocoela muelleri]|nr:hypothetical protein DMUE_0821 [Dictyocoela muelleri]